MPDGYRGVVVRRKGSEGEKPKAKDRWRGEYGNDVEGEEQEEGEEDVAVLEELATFEEVVVWDHEKVVEDDDGIVKGLEEWIRFAEAVSSFFLSLFLSCFSFYYSMKISLIKRGKSMFKR